MKRLKFKLIPFIISVLIVVVSVFLVCSYAYKKYEANKLRFIYNYFHKDNYSEVSCEDQIEDFAKFTSVYYSSKGDEFTFYDVKSGNKYGETPAKSSFNFIDGASYKDGVLHLEDWFDMKIYAMTTYNTDSKEWVYTYYFFIYNVNYKNSTLISQLYFTFVDGIGNEESEFVGTVKLNTVMDEIKTGKNADANTVNCPSYVYSYNGSDGNTYSGDTLYLHDNGAHGTYGNGNIYIYRLTTMNETLSVGDKETLTERRWLYEMDSATFSIFTVGGSGILSTNEDDYTELVRGTYERKYQKAEDFNAAVSDESSKVIKGYDRNLYDAGYGKFIAGRIAITGLITFVISGIVGFLFYLIWQDAPEDKSANDPKVPKKKKAKE